jgi:predicted metal-binding membrane protein
MTAVGLERQTRRDRVIAVATVMLVAALAWVWLWREARRMGAMPMDTMAMSMDGMAPASPWASGALLLTFAMWTVMMVGMMLPSAAPTIALYGGLVRRHRAAGSVLPSVWIFAAGYLAVWTGFSALATALHAGLASLRLLTPAMASASVWLTAALLILAGIYQWLPLKDVCLNKCRSPLQFLLFHWRAGAFGAFRMGAAHGAYCVGCCWALMLLLFAAGVMNLLWVAAIAGFVLIEKLLPGGRPIGRAAGLALVVLGASLPVARW